MKYNLGGLDRIVRVILAVLIAVLYFTDMISGMTAIILGALALIFLVTSMIGFCPLYFLFRLSTKKSQKA